MKKGYVRPVMIAESFRPDEYVALCADGVCNISGKVYLDWVDKDGDNQADSGEYSSSRTNIACGEDYVIRQNGAQELPAKNCIIEEYTTVDSWLLGKQLDEPTGRWVTGWNFERQHTTTSVTVDPKRPNHS